MLGNMSLGVLFRDPTGYRVDCGACGHTASLRAVDLPAAVKVEEAAALHKCKVCGSSSGKTRIIFDSNEP